MQIADLLVPFLPEASSKIKAIFAEGVVSSSDPIFPKIYIHTKDPRTEHGRQSMLIDTHCHIQDSSYDFPSIDELIKRARGLLVSDQYNTTDLN